MGPGPMSGDKVYAGIQLTSKLGLRMPMLHRRAGWGEPPLALMVTYGMTSAEEHVIRLPPEAHPFRDLRHQPHELDQAHATGSLWGVS